MKIDLFCSGSKGNCCLIRSKSTQLVIDCGSTKKYLMDHFRMAEANIKDTDALLITHSHSDHISQIKLFDSIPTYSYCDLDVDHTIIEPGEVLEIGDFSIHVIALSHDASHTIGFVIYNDNEKLVYITDTGYIPNRQAKLLKDATYYIFESNHDMDALMKSNRPMFLKQRISSDVGHMNNVDASRWLCHLVSDETKEVVLAHISDDCNTPTLAKQVFLDTLSENNVPIQFSIEAMPQRTWHSFGNK
ncbi:MBL fold metallo-hydrolase [Floccifex sp.]|uniref:MBL fold metallo-hydrolase n=1 Tax=Floccifex sp. TaxID=2815810 RepID=UPI002A755E47|nr:MBL fold metallo-hydrolase [Floccifex sp.]MDD7281357.1 MBL fold metallo-hydrolase [Erysipelotrichaceae bacterium]MDY2958010.1 MBL fold metallo-hydrolase [Floccifex sp.]